jgi:hypothetical protein
MDRLQMQPMVASMPFITIAAALRSGQLDFPFFLASPSTSLALDR